MVIFGFSCAVRKAYEQGSSYTNTMSLSYLTMNFLQNDIYVLV